MTGLAAGIAMLFARLSPSYNNVLLRGGAFAAVLLTDLRDYNTVRDKNRADVVGRVKTLGDSEASYSSRYD